MKRMISLLLCLILISCSTPITAFAADKPVLSVDGRDLYSTDLSWSYNGSYDGTVIEKSADGKTWSTVSDSAWGSNYYASHSPKEVCYYRIKTYTVTYDEETWEEHYSYSPYSNWVKAYPELSETMDTWNTYAYASAKKTTLEWSYYSNYLPYIDGFLIYKSVNGKAFALTKTVAASKYNEKRDSRVYYTLKENAPSKYGYSVRYIVCPYYTNAGAKYFTKNESEAEDCSYLDYDNFAKVTTKKSSIVIKLKKLSDSPTYTIKYTKYNLKSGKTSKTKTIKTKKTSYTLKKTDASKYGYYLEIAPSWGNIQTSSAFYEDSHSAMPLMRGAAKSKKKTISVLNTRGKKTKTHWTYSLSKKDKKIIKKFFDKHFKNNKDATREEKALYALEWINKNVTYDYQYKAGSLSYADAIFNKKLGQCLQYNGAFAEVLVYLGYEARIIEGYRSDSNGKPTINHYWCEVKVHGKWYLCETGNYGKNGDWSYFCSRYANSRGYTKNGKPAKD